MESPIDQIKSRLDVIDVISEYVQLKQSGQNWKGLCPFHSEKTPSFMVHREKQIWHCFGCNTGGDIFEFVQKIENVEFVEALEILARKANVELKFQDRQESGKKTRALEMIREADDFFHNQLLKSPAAKVARDYLTGRGVDIETAKAFHLGYAPDSWEGLAKYLQSKGYKPAELMAVGLVVQHTRGGCYDKFRDRIMFPIQDIHDRTIGFGGRVLKNKSDEPKYMNSPQSLVYNKSLVLYNLNRSRNFIRENCFAVLVEGYMDVIGCYQAGVKNVVSVSGTALTIEQVKILKRYVNEIRLAFDADLAGQSASERGIDLVLQAEMEVKIIAFPQDEDPDTWSRKNPEAFNQSIAEALPIGDYTLRHILQNINVSSREGKKQASEQMLKAIAKLPNPIDKDYYLKKTSKDLGVDETSLRERLTMVDKVRSNKMTGLVFEKNITEHQDREELLIQKLVSMLIYLPQEVEYIVNNLSANMILAGDTQELYNQALVFYTDRKRLDIDEFKRELSANDKLIKLLNSLYLQAERDFSDLEPGEARGEIDILIRALKSIYFTRELKLLSESIRQAEAGGDQTTLVSLLERFNDLSRQLTQLDKNYGESKDSEKNY